MDCGGDPQCSRNILMLKLNQLYNMDCMDGMKEFPDKYFDLAIVDPPYGINVARKGEIGGGDFNKDNKIQTLTMGRNTPAERIL